MLLLPFKPSGAADLLTIDSLLPEGLQRTRLAELSFNGRMELMVTSISQLAVDLVLVALRPFIVLSFSFSAISVCSGSPVLC